jgi:hypothetical protein
VIVSRWSPVLAAVSLLAFAHVPSALAQPTPAEPPVEGTPPPGSETPPPGDPTPPAPAQPDPGPTGTETGDGGETAIDPVPAGPTSQPEVPTGPSDVSGKGEPVPPEATVDEASRGSGGESGFMDIRLNLTLVNENVFAEPGETIPSVPGWRFGRPNSLGTLFFDNYETRFSGYETLSHAVLYKSYNREEWEVEGALVLRINDLAERSIDLSDAGSYVRVAHWFDPTRKEKKLVSLTAFPTSSDRMRLGYSWRLSWGGSPEYQRSRAAVPGVKLQFDTERAYAYVGAKSAVVLDRSTAEEEAVLAVLAGGGIDVTDMVRIEANGGYFDRGGNELQDVITEKVRLYGASAQVAIHKDEPVTSSVDYKLYRNDPERAYHMFAREEYPGGLSWLVAGEATVLGQTLKDPVASGSTTVQVGIAGDINTRVKIDRTRLRLDLQFRDLAFILHSTPSLPTYSDFPPEYERTANFFAAVGADQNIEGTGLTLGVIAGIDMPATLVTPTGGLPGDMVEGGGSSTAVIRNEGDITVLPPGEDALPQLALKLTQRLDFAESFAALSDIYYTRDPNQTRLLRDNPEEPLRREFGEFNQLGFNFTLQAKF